MTAQDQIGDSTETRDPLELTSAGVERDWPGPLRAEPAGDAVVAAQRLTNARGEWEYLDESDGEDLAEYPWLDIVRVGMSDSRATFLTLAAIPEPADPAEHRRAYGVVVDTDLDGVADYRLGMENIAAYEYRLWTTDLRTGETSAGTGAPYVAMGDSLPEASYPGDPWFERGMSIMTRPVRGTRVRIASTRGRRRSRTAASWPATTLPIQDGSSLGLAPGVDVTLRPDRASTHEVCSASGGNRPSPAT